ncbi:hypothetical protein TNCV_3050671 [Trichonephila clavipes]|nr:hypothetical protein TNCV_3050671 [Trichonephila clavipes]
MMNFVGLDLTTSDRYDIYEGGGKHNRSSSCFKQTDLPLSWVEAVASLKPRICVKVAARGWIAVFLMAMSCRGDVR